MKALCLTIDLDRDVNLQVDGIGAGSIDRGSGTAPRFTSSSEGLEIITDILEEMGVVATFFAEGRTLETLESVDCLKHHEVGVHGYDHEDLTSISSEQIKSIIKHTADIISKRTGTQPTCFRAPYMTVNESVLEAVSDSGLKVDSSYYSDIQHTMLPYELENGLIEVPVPRGKDKAGKKMEAYLWPMHEFRRSPQHYVEMASSIQGGIFNLATHTWHIVESRSSGIMDAETRKTNCDNFREVIEDILKSGFEPMTITAAAEYFKN